MSFQTIIDTSPQRHGFKPFLISNAKKFALVYLAISVCFLVFAIAYANALNKRHTLEFKLTKYSGPYIRELNNITNPDAWRANIPTNFSRYAQTSGKMPDYFTASSLFKMTMTNLDSQISFYLDNDSSFDGVKVTLRDKKRLGHFLLKIEASGDDTESRFLADKIIKSAVDMSKSDLLRNLSNTKTEIEEILLTQLAHRNSIRQAGSVEDFKPLEAQILKQHIDYLQSQIIDNSAFIARTFKPYSIANITSEKSSRITNYVFCILAALLFALLAFAMYISALFGRDRFAQISAAYAVK